MGCTLPAHTQRIHLRGRTDGKEEGNHSPGPAVLLDFTPPGGDSSAAHTSPCPAAAARGRGPKQPLHSTQCSTTEQHHGAALPLPATLPYKSNTNKITKIRLGPTSRSGWIITTSSSQTAAPGTLLHIHHLQSLWPMSAGRWPPPSASSALQAGPALPAGGVGRQAEPPPRCNRSLIASCSFTIQVKPSLLGRMGSLLLRGMELSNAQQWALCSATWSPGSAAAPTAMPFPPEELSVLLNEQHRVNHHCLERMGFGPPPCSTPCAAQSITPCCQTAQSKQPTHAPRLPTEHRGWMNTVSKRLKLHLWKPGGALWGPENNICSAGKGPLEPPQPKPKL